MQVRYQAALRPEQKKNYNRHFIRLELLRTNKARDHYKLVAKQIDHVLQFLAQLLDIDRCRHRS